LGFTFDFHSSKTGSIPSAACFKPGHFVPLRPRTRKMVSRNVSPGTPKRRDRGRLRWLPQMVRGLFLLVGLCVEAIRHKNALPEGEWENLALPDRGRETGRVSNSAEERDSRKQKTIGRKNIESIKGTRRKPSGTTIFGTPLRQQRKWRRKGRQTPPTTHLNGTNKRGGDMGEKNE